MLLIILYGIYSIKYYYFIIINETNFINEPAPATSYYLYIYIYIYIYKYITMSKIAILLAICCLPNVVIGLTSIHPGKLTSLEK